MSKLFLYIVAVVLLGCVQQKGPKSPNVISNSTLTEKSCVSELSDPYPKPFLIPPVNENEFRKDTVIGEWRIAYCLQQNGDTVKGYYNLPDRSIFISLRKANKQILLNREIRKREIAHMVPEDDLQFYEIWRLSIESVTDEELKFFANFCRPDSDDCYPIDIFVNNEGAIRSEINEEISNAPWGD